MTLSVFLDLPKNLMLLNVINVFLHVVSKVSILNARIRRRKIEMVIFIK